MQVITTRSALTPLLLREKALGRKIGFVPTMGALHDGHLSLIAESRKRADITVSSVFVNPTQFNDPKDLAKYPRQPEKDAAMLEKAGCDYLYLPAVEDVYPEGPGKGPFFDLGGIDTRLEGASRPGHFAGVAEVVKVLVETVVPDLLFLGQKDFQQCMVVKRMLDQWDKHHWDSALQEASLNWRPGDVELVICPIIREAHGLAMSSRNERLSGEMRNRASAIYASIQYAEELFPTFSADEISTICANALNSIPDFQVDYFQILDGETLSPANADTQKFVIITAVIVAGVRLLDNKIIIN